MDATKRTVLMHAVLDAEASVAEADELMRLLAADPAAQAEFEELQRLFDELKGLPAMFPPEGLYAAVMSRLPKHQDGARQLLESPGVIDSPKGRSSTQRSGTSSSSRRRFAPEPQLKEHFMSEQESKPFSKRKAALLGVGVAVIAGVVVATSGIYFPAGSSDTAGTIVPAQRFRAAQPTGNNVQPGGQTETAPRAPEGSAGGVGDGRAVNALQDGRVNQLQDGRVNQLQDGRVNQLQDGRVNQLQDGRVNQLQDGRVNQLQDGRVNQLQDGRVNALQDGRTTDARTDGRTTDAMKSSDGRAAKN
jgi:anti-sigma factor RsiW